MLRKLFNRKFFPTFKTSYNIFRFFHPCRLAKHLKTHERPYSCTECSRTFSREDTLNKHVNKKHGIIMITQQADEDQLVEEQDIKISVTTTDTEEHIIFCT